MPLGLTVGGLCCSLSWTIYSVLVGDILVFLPNILGDILGILQLLVYLRYRVSDKQELSSPLLEDAGESVQNMLPIATA